MAKFRRNKKYTKRTGRKRPRQSKTVKYALKRQKKFRNIRKEAMTGEARLIWQNVTGYTTMANFV